MQNHYTTGQPDPLPMSQTTGTLTILAAIREEIQEYATVLNVNHGLPTTPYEYLSISKGPTIGSGHHHPHPYCCIYLKGTTLTLIGHREHRHHSGITSTSESTTYHIADPHSIDQLLTDLRKFLDNDNTLDDKIDQLGHREYGLIYYPKRENIPQ